MLEPQDEREERFKEEMEKMAQLFMRKNRDYGDSAFKTFEKYGPTSFLIRIEDKLNRLDRLINKDCSQNVADESIRDTIRDAANYAIMFLIAMEERDD